MSARRRFVLKVASLIILVVAMVSTPFVLWGETLAQPLLTAPPASTALLVALAIALLAVDSVAPVPATLVIMFLAAKAGVVVGIVGAMAGLSAGVLTASWFGRFALGRIAPRFFPDGELARLRAGLQQNLALTLACWRSVPVLAETSVILAAAAGIPTARIFRVTLLPNFVIAVIYSVAADESFLTASLAFLLTLGLSLAAWRWSTRRATRAASPAIPR